MPLQFVRNDITKMECDAIVNAANETLLGGGGVDGAIHRAAGPALLSECIQLHGCKTGCAKITKGYNLKCKYIIHTVGPVWHGGDRDEEKLLRSCYESSLRLAKEYNCKSIAFPLISTGVYGYPVSKGLKVAIDTAVNFLMENDMLIYIVFFGKDSTAVGNNLISDLKQYIDDNYVEAHTDPDFELMRSMHISNILDSCEIQQVPYNHVPQGDRVCSAALEETEKGNAPLSDYLKNVKDESFSQMLLRKIDESGITDSECYHRANIDRKLFSKIRSNPNYRPAKPTVLAFCIALHLSLNETREMLMKAGYALSHSSVFDIVVEYFIINNIYDIYQINEALFELDQKLLGSAG